MFIINRIRTSKFTLLIFSSILGSLPSLLLYTQLYIIGILITGIFNELALSIIYSIIVSLQKENLTVGLTLVNSINILIGMNLESVASYSGYYM